MDPLVSIVIPVYNGSNYLREAIDSALAQTYSNIEIIVVNDGSNDDGATWKIAHSYGDKIRYFEKPNGGVSTALNFGIANMRGKYFSWLSHDDLYYPNKIQTEIDALRKSGDMTRAVLSKCATLDANKNIILNCNHDRYHRQNFLETGALTPIFGFINGCAFLIPKIYFDAYGTFDENYRAVQDYKKWFEMFRGKRIIYVREYTSIYRPHPKQVSKNYTGVKKENHWLFHWMIQNVEEDDLVGSGLSDMYHFYSAAFTKWFGSEYTEAVELCINKLMQLPESPDIEKRAQNFIDILNEDKIETYFLEEEFKAIEFALNLRGITPPHLRIISRKDINKVIGNNVRIFNYFSLLQAFFDTPIRKKNLQKLFVK